MSVSTLALMVLSLCLALGGWLVFVWAMRRGQFDDAEGPKHRMMDDDEDANEEGES